MITDEAATAYKEQVRQTWSDGDYDQLAVRVMPIAEHLCTIAGIGADQAVLDVATGTGNVAVAAARRGARVTAVDLTPAMVARTEQRARDEGVSIEVLLGDAEDLPFSDDTFDAVLSVCGLWWAPRPEQAIAEARRVARPGAVIGLAGFTPGSYFGQIEELIKARSPLPAGVPERNDWARADLGGQRLAEHVGDVQSVRGVVEWSFPDAATATRFLFENSASHLAAVRRLPPPVAQQLLNEVIDLTERASTTEGTITIDLEYLILLGAVP